MPLQRPELSPSSSPSSIRSDYGYITNQAWGSTASLVLNVNAPCNIYVGGELPDGIQLGSQCSNETITTCPMTNDRRQQKEMTVEENTRKSVQAQQVRVNRDGFVVTTISGQLETQKISHVLPLNQGNQWIKSRCTNFYSFIRLLLSVASIALAMVMIYSLTGFVLGYSVEPVAFKAYNYSSGSDSILEGEELLHTSTTTTLIKNESLNLTSPDAITLKLNLTVL